MKDITKIPKKFLRKITGRDALVEVTNQLSGLNTKIADVESSLASRTEQLLAGDARHNNSFDSLGRQGIGAQLNKILARDKSKRSIFNLSTHGWVNIGDQAINYCESVFLRKNFPELNIYNIDRLTLLASWQLIVDTIQPSDIIVLHGGGNMGDIWLHEEYARRKIVETFKDNIIIGFPQSIKYYDENELKVSADIYNAHKKLMIATRDDASFKLAKEYFSGIKVIRTEDIVMGYEYPAQHRAVQEHILFATRNDMEKKDVPALENIRRIIGNEFNIVDTDTIMSDVDFVDSEYGSMQVYLKIDEFHAAKLIVTDRLHGAVFALHAGRPVVVVDNSYGKIKGALKLVSKSLGNRILFADDDASNVTVEALRKMYTMGEAPKSPSQIVGSELEDFAQELKKFISN